MSDPVLDLAAAAGIALSYHDTTGTERVTARETAQALLAAMGLPATTATEAAETRTALAAEEAARALPRWVVIPAETPATLTCAAPVDAFSLHLEDGSETGGPARGLDIALPPLPVGYHVLRVEGAEALILSAPLRLPLPARGWGVTLPLYGLRTTEAGGFGDFDDLRDAVAACASLGAGFVGINPIHAGFPTDPQAFSPYTPSHRRRLNALHVAVPDDRGARTDLIDYARDIPAKRAALEAAFAARTVGDDAALDRFLGEGGLPLRRFATHQALSEVHGPDWRAWPVEVRDPVAPTVAQFASEHVERLRFHAWAQMAAARQLGAVRDAGRDMAQGLYLDLAVGTHPGGAETWEDRASFARGVSLGAPPDAFSPTGQAWNLAPLCPRALVAVRFAPLIETLRAQLRFARMLRIDHILGFARAFWVPEDGGVPGGYVAMPRDAMLAVARIEAARAGAVIVGEDLGNIPGALREAMAEGGILGCRVAMFERDAAGFRPPDTYDTDTLASFTTHDLPTWRGWRAGRDIDWRERLGEVDAAQAADARAERAREVAAFDAARGTDDPAPETLHAHLGNAAARLVAVQAEDMLGHVEQPNLPGTVHDHPNWRRRLAVPPRALADTDAARATAAALDARRPNGGQTP